MSKSLGEGGGVKAATGAPAREARPLRPAVSPSIMEKPCAQLKSVAAVTAWRLDRGERVEVQIDDRLKRFRGRGFAQRFRQGIEPFGVIGLDVDHLAHGVAPTLSAATPIKGPTRANHDGWRWSLMFRPPPRLTFGIAQ